MPRHAPAPFALLLAAALAGCAPRIAPPPVVFPVGDPWTATFDGPLDGPLATDGTRLFVATRGGTLTALEPSTGRTLWTTANRPGVLATGEDLLVTHGADGTVWALDPKSGSALWKQPSDIGGTLPAAIYGGRVYVGGDGLMALDARSGHLLWSVQPKVKLTAPPAAHGPWLFTGEEGHGLVCRDAVTGVVRWSYTEAGDPVAAPAVDEDGNVYFAGSDRRFLSLDGDDGGRRWRWKVGASVQTPSTLLARRVLVTSNEAVIYALFDGGNMAWRAALPSRPLSGPILVGSLIVVACHGLRPSEGSVVGFDARTGQRIGDLRTSAEIAAAPLVLALRVIIPLRNQTVMGFAMGVAPPSPSPSPSASPSPSGSPSPESAPDLDTPSTGG